MTRTATVRRVVTVEYEVTSLTTVEARRIITSLSLTQRELATLMGVTERSIRNWLRDDDGESSLPLAISNCLRAWAQLHELKLPWSPLVRKD